MVKIGEKIEDKSVWNTYFLPEKNKMVQRTAIGIFVYDVEFYPVSETEIVVKPLKTELLSNFPNPFNPETTIRFNLAKDSDVSIDIFNIRGQKVRLLVSGYWCQGEYSVVWDGRDDNGVSLGSGVYFYHLRAGDFSETRRMLLLK